MDFSAALAALAPSAGLAVIFWIVIRAIMNADRTERAAMARMDAAEEAARADTAKKSDLPDS